MKEGDLPEPLPVMVRAYLNAESLANRLDIKADSRIKFNNSLGTLEHFMTPTERQVLRKVKDLAAGSKPTPPAPIRNTKHE